MNSTVLAGNAQNIIYELLNHHTIEELKDGDKTEGYIDSTADALCTYTHECIAMVDELSTKYGEYVEDSGATFEPHEWTSAVRDWAISLCREALREQVGAVISELLESIEEFETAVEELEGDPDKAHIGDCAYGWAVHNYEHLNGLMVWSDERDNSNGCFNPELLEGELIAVSHRLPTGQYINACWTPDRD